MAYHMLFRRDEDTRRWIPEFGDRERECVEFERDEYRDHGDAARDLKIVRFDRVPSQAQVDARAEQLNARDNQPAAPRIVQKRYAGTLWTLRHEKTLAPVEHRATITSFRGGVSQLSASAGHPPRHIGSSGHVWTESGAEFYPSVFGLVWTPESEVA